MSTTHHLEPSRRTLHGAFSPTLEPALRIAPGDRVVFHDTLDVSWGMGQHVRGALTRPKFEPRQNPRDNGPGLMGPIHVEGLRAGDTLAVTLEAIRPADYGWIYHGPSPFNAALNAAIGLTDAQPRLMLWELDADARTATSEHGLTLEMRPFLGTIGICPPVEGWHMGWHPTAQGGNLDAKELIEGTTVYFPVAVDGALFSLGDGHARQGDGEVAGTAIECRMERVQCHFAHAHDVPKLPTTWAQTPSGWVTFGVSTSLDEAMGVALSAMLDVMQWRLDVDRSDAVCLASALVDVRVTQAVNGVRGVHCVWTDEAA